jgi:uncharacterized protein YndB with AHSA1/START domain
MTKLAGSVTEIVQTSPEAIFTLVTDIDRLPDWNQIIQRVVERPAIFKEGAEWVVEMQAMGSTWNSRSRVEEYDQRALRFAYRAQTDDGNPSYAVWTWEIAEHPEGARVTVRWELVPKTFWRQALLARIRNRQLRREVAASIREVERLVRS